MIRNNPPLVSVIITHLNAERFLDEAINSVYSQSFSDWELLLVDDGSDDGSARIASAHANCNHSKIRCLEHEGRQNRGISASRNLGIHHAKGELLAFLDADDCWAPDRLEKQLAILDFHPDVGMIIGATLYWYEWSDPDENAARDSLVKIGAPQDQVITPPDLLTDLYPLGKGSAPSMSGIIVRRSVVDQVGGFDERFHGMYEDQAFLTKVYLHTPVYVSSVCFDFYRQHKDSCVAVAHATGQYNMVRQQFLESFALYLKQHRIYTPQIWRALERAQWRYRHPRAATLLHLSKGLVRRFIVG